MKRVKSISLACLMLGSAGFIAHRANADDGIRIHTIRGDDATPEQKAEEDRRGAEATRLEKLAADALETGHYADAEAYARNAIAVFPVGFSGSILAEALLKQGKEKEAIDVYQGLYDSRSEDPCEMLPFCLLKLKTGGNPEDWKTAVTAYERSIRLINKSDLLKARYHFSPDTPDAQNLATAAHIALGLAYVSIIDYAGKPQDTKSLPEIDAAFALSPGLDLATYYKAVILERLRRTDDAKTAYEQAAQIGQPDVQAAANKALDRIKKHL